MAGVKEEEGMIINRCMYPLSKLKVDEWLKEDIYLPGGESVKIQHLYRGLDFLELSKDALEDELFWQSRNLFNREVDLIFYDTTSISIFSFSRLYHGYKDCQRYGR